MSELIDLRGVRNFRRRRDDRIHYEYDPPTIPDHSIIAPPIVPRVDALPIISLSAWQSEVFNNESRFRVKVCGRRSGKSFEDAIELIRAAVNGRDRMVWYVAPTYKMAKEIMWRQLKLLIPRSYLKRKPLETDLIFEFINNSILQLKGAEDPDSLRGPGLDFLAVDEFAYIDPRAWFEVMRPMVSDRMGRVTFSTTPAGLNWAYDLYSNGINKEVGWASFTATSLSGGRIPAAEIRDARNTMSARVFRQEYEASFETVGHRVYEDCDPLINFRDDIVDLPSQELLVGMDFNVNPMSLVLGVKAAEQLHIFEALEIETSNTTEVAHYLRERFPDRAIICTPDPSGKARKTSAAGETDFSILRAHNIEIDAATSAPPVRDRINATNAMFCAADGVRRLFVSKKCEKTLGRSLRGLAYKPDTNIPNPKGGLVHITDGLGYLVWQRFNLLEQEWTNTKVRY